MHADADADSVQLAWTLNGWSDGVTGFVVMRWNSAGDAPGWERIHAGTIEPGIAPEKNFSPVEPDQTRRRELTSRLRAALDAGRVQPVSPEEFFATLRAPPEDFLGALRRELFLDHDRALWLGLGCIDRNPSAQGPLRYGLFPVRNAQVASEPAAECEAARPSADARQLQAGELNVARREVGTTITWRVNNQAAQQRSVYGYRVYRARRGTNEYELLTPLGIGSAHVEDGWRHFTFVDRSADEGVDYDYRVVPFNFFQRELNVPATTAYAPNLATTLGQSAIQLIAEQDPDTRQVRLSWQTTGAVAEFADGFIAERVRLPGNELTAFSPSLPTTTQSFVDPEPKRHEEAFAYRVTAMRDGRPVLNSNVAIVVAVDLPTPPAPAGLAAEWVTLGDDVFVRLQWEPRSPEDTLTRGYLLYADIDTPGEIVRQASVAEVKVPQTQAVLPINLLDSRVLTVGIAAVAFNGQLGPVTQTTVFAPGRLPTAVADLSATQAETDNNTAVLLSWDYPAGHEIAGFRIRVNGSRAADESELRGDARSWRFAVERGSRAQFLFEVVAVSLAGETSMSRQATFSPVRLEGSSLRPRSPENFRTAWNEDRTAITLRWDESEGLGYSFAVDADTLGVFNPPTEIFGGDPGAFVFTPSDPDRSYTFRLWALGPQVNPGPRPSSIYAESLCLPPGRTLPPAKLARAQRVRDENETEVIELSWIYPASDELAGFRISQNGEPVVGETALMPEVRTWTVPVPTEPGRYAYTIAAIGQSGEVSESGPARIVVLR